jgi:phosphoribosylaminoimidazole-succinocarboxamide synthase
MNSHLQSIELLEGKAKILEINHEESFCLMQFKDVLTAFNGKQFEEAPDKGKLNASISAKLFEFLNKQKIQTHFIAQENENTLKVKPLEMLRLEVIVRNYAAGSLCRRLCLPEGRKLQKTIVQFHLKDDSLDDPLLTEDEITELELLNKSSFRQIKNLSLMINWLLQGVFKQAGICLVDAKFEFGLDKDGNYVLADELSPDNMRLWLDYSNENSQILKLDKDRFRENLGGLIQSYEQVLKKLEQTLSGTIELEENPVEIELFIRPQANLLDPTGRTLTQAANQLGFHEVTAIQAGKILDLNLSDLRVNLIEEMCERLLASPASESFEYEIHEKAH